jgi:dephospho-CoA kinase
VSAILRVGLTGGIGSGKSTVARFLADCGARIIDADAISRGLTTAGGQAIPLIAQTFGSSFVDADGAMNREKMRSLVYSDVTSRSELEAIIHPMVASAIKLQTHHAMTDNCKVVVYDIPLLVESLHWRERVDQLLVVDTTPEIQIGRVMARSGMTAVQVEKIIASQACRQHRLHAADTVICNTTLSLGQLASEVQFIARRFGLSCS